MFAHIFTTRLKCLIRNKQVVFWTLAFPLLLATFFKMSLANVNQHEAFHPIDIAVVNDASYQQDENFKATLEQVSTGENRIFNLTVTSREEADSLLDSDKIKGYLTAGPEIRMTVKGQGLSQSILKAFADQYGRTSSAVASIVKENPEAIRQGLLDDLGVRREYTREVSGNSAEPNNVLNYFYSLIAMACLYGSFWGLKEITDIQADLSSLAARINVAPVHKLKTFLYGMCAALLLQFAEVLVLLAYLRFGFKIDFGPKTGYVLLTSFAGCVAGLSLGAFVSAVVKKGEGTKVAILISTTMIGSFLSGMMFGNMKYIVARNAPVISYLNPVNLLTDAFYSLYYYDTLTRYALNMGLLCAFIFVFCTAAYFIIRRQKYASL